MTLVKESLAPIKVETAGIDRGGDLKVKLSPVANDVIVHAYIMESP